MLNLLDLQNFSVFWKILSPRQISEFLKRKSNTLIYKCKSKFREN